MRFRDEGSPSIESGHCAGCGSFPAKLFRVSPQVCRYRCASCFERETGGAPVEPFEYRPVEYVCGCGKKRFGPCPTCGSIFQVEQREARRA